jgi:hypothetical protein
MKNWERKKLQASSYIERSTQKEIKRKKLFYSSNQQAPKNEIKRNVTISGCLKKIKKHW